MKLRTWVAVGASVAAVVVWYVGYYDAYVIADKACLRARVGAPAEPAKAQLRAVAAGRRSEVRAPPKGCAISNAICKQGNRTAAAGCWATRNWRPGNWLTRNGNSPRRPAAAARHPPTAHQRALGRPPRARMTGRDARLDGVGPARPSERLRTFERRQTAADEHLVPAGAVLVQQQHRLTRRTDARS